MKFTVAALAALILAAGSELSFALVGITPLPAVGRPAIRRRWTEPAPSSATTPRCLSSAFVPAAPPCVSIPSSRRWRHCTAAAAAVTPPTTALNLAAAARDEDGVDRWDGDGGAVDRPDVPSRERRRAPAPAATQRPPPRSVGTRDIADDGPDSAAAKELRRMASRAAAVENDGAGEGEGEGDSYYDDYVGDDDGGEFDPRYEGGEWDDDEYEYDDDENYYDDDCDDGEDGAGGNYWSNPRGKLDPFPSTGRRRATSGIGSGARQRPTPPSTAGPQPETKARGSRRRPSGSREGDGPTRTSEDLYGRPPPRRSSGAIQRTTFRSGTPPPPPLMKNFYDRFFWYGFDPNQTTSSEDRTMFGGTKGKFRGLDILRDYDGDPISRRDAHGGGRGGGYDDDDYYDDEDDYDYFDEGREEERGGSNRKALPPPEIPRPLLPGLSMEERKSDRPPPPRSRRRRGGRERYDEGDDNDGFDDAYNDSRRSDRSRSSRRGRERLQSNGGWAAGEVSSWFDEEGDDDNGGRNDAEEDEEEEDKYWGRDDSYGRSMSRRRDRSGREGRRGDGRVGQQPSAPQSLLRIVDSVFGLDPDDIGQKAREYDQKIGRAPKRPTRARRGRGDTDPRRRRKGHAYRYVDDDGLPPVAEYGPVLDVQDVGGGDAQFEEENASRRDVLRNGTIDTFAEEVSPGRVGPRRTTKPRRQKRPQRTWEDRESEDTDRVPPSGVTAWGPGGEVMGGVDARTQAALMAMEEIREAKRTVEEKEERVINAEEKVLLLKANAAMQRKTISDRGEKEAVRARLRQMNLKVEDAARMLRRARAELDVALGRVEELEDRHWSLLSQVEADETFTKLAASSTNEKPDAQDAGAAAVRGNTDAIDGADIMVKTASNDGAKDEKAPKENEGTS